MGRAKITMNRVEIEKAIEPIIEKCRRKFAPGSSETEDSPDTDESLRPETRRVSLIASLAESVLGNDLAGRGLEVGSGYGCLLFPMASLFPQIHWFAIEHPDQPYASRETYRRACSRLRATPYCSTGVSRPIVTLELTTAAVYRAARSTGNPRCLNPTQVRIPRK
jgi:hypothetical protein